MQGPRATRERGSRRFEQLFHLSHLNDSLGGNAETRTARPVRPRLALYLPQPHRVPDTYQTLHKLKKKSEEKVLTT